MTDLEHTGRAVLRRAASWLIVPLLFAQACASEPGGAHDEGASDAAPIDAAPIDTDAPIDPADGGATSPDAAPLDDGGPAASCALPERFQASPSAYALPAPRCGVRFDRLARSSDFAYGRIDLVGDRGADLVVYRDPCTAQIGQSRWDVYRAREDGFDPAPSAYALPAPRCGRSFNDLASTGPVRWALLDLVSDARPDLVVFRDDCDASVGSDHWDVYAASDTGFASKPTRFAVPASRCKTRFDTASSRSAASYGLVDLSGDGRVDIVVHRDACDAAVGRDRWDVYASGASGFAAAPKAYALPAPRCKTRFELLSDRGAVGYSLLDLGGDRRPDLVVHEDVCDASIGRSRWDVHVAGDSGFAAGPVAFSLPAPRCDEPFFDLHGNASVGYGLVDLTCDGRPELVVHRDACDADVGKLRWDTYVAGPTGFAAAPRALGVPASRCTASFDALSSGSFLGFALTTLGEPAGPPSLVVHRDDCDSEIGKSRWDHHPLR